VADGLGKNKRIYSGSVIPDDRVAHYQRNEKRHRHKTEAAKESCNVEVAVCGPTSAGSGTGKTPENSVSAEKNHQSVWRNSFRVE
jgi:hypothetical protein